MLRWTKTLDRSTQRIMLFSLAGCYVAFIGQSAYADAEQPLSAGVSAQYFLLGAQPKVNALFLANKGWMAFQAWVITQQIQPLLEQYHALLVAKKVHTVVSMPELLSAQRDTVKCDVAPWVIPPQALHANIVPALSALKRLKEQKLITKEDRVTSVYRESAQNVCAGGASKSKHMNNEAIDIELKGKTAAQRYITLCDFWDKEGPKMRLGLGMYFNLKTHVDGSGWRTWGPTYNKDSSRCTWRMLWSMPILPDASTPRALPQAITHLPFKNKTGSTAILWPFA